LSEILDFHELRSHVDHIPSRRDKVLLETLYLTASRVSEIITKVCPSEQNTTKSYGQFLDWKIAKYSDEPVLLIIEAVAKREFQKNGGVVRKHIAPSSL